MRLDSFGYRLFWQLKKVFYRYPSRCGPLPVVERKIDTFGLEEPCRHFVPPAAVAEAVQQRNCAEQSDNYARLCAQLQLLPRLTNYLPTHLEERDWHHLLSMNSVKERCEYLGFLIQKRKKKAKTARYKQQMKAASEQRKLAAMEDVEVQEEEKGKYALNMGKTTGEATEGSSRNGNVTKSLRDRFISMPYIMKEEREAASLRYIRSLQLAETPRIAIDCRFLALHTKRGMNLTMLQLQKLLSANRDRQCPWPIHLCNFADDDADVVAMRRKHLRILDSILSISGEATSASYSQLFPALAAANKIVYLSPHARESLTHVDADTCYVIGAIVDRAREPRIPLKASLLISEQEQLPCRRFPIPSEFLRGGNAMLTLVQVIAILQHVYHSADGNDWHGAFERHIPKRKRLAPAEKNTLMRVRYDNIHERNRQVAKIVEERTASSAAAAAGMRSSSINDHFNAGKQILIRMFS